MLLLQCLLGEGFLPMAPMYIGAMPQFPGPGRGRPDALDAIPTDISGGLRSVLCAPVVVSLRIVYLMSGSEWSAHAPDSLSYMQRAACSLRLPMRGLSVLPMLLLRCREARLSSGWRRTD